MNGEERTELQREMLNTKKPAYCVKHSQLHEPAVLFLGIHPREVKTSVHTDAADECLEQLYSSSPKPTSWGVDARTEAHHAKEEPRVSVTHNTMDLRDMVLSESQSPKAASL